MRKLLYVPIIHTESDLGSAGPAMDRISASLCGPKKWARHKAAVTQFWSKVADYVSPIAATDLKIYQDGLVAGGELGRKIIEEGARQGSRNYEIVLDLTERGAQIIATEDVALLREEYERIGKLSQAKSPAQRAAALREYESRKDPLTKERDRFVAKTINATLKEGEVGILFMGAHHDVLAYLAEDIVVEQIKEREKLSAYFRELMQGRDEEEFEQLARYLALPIDCTNRGEDA